MKKIRAIFIDFDWTIYDHNNHCIPESTIKALNEAKKNGVKLFINSARTYYSLAGQNICNLVQFDGYGVINGCASFSNDRLFHAYYLKREYVDEIIKIANENHLSYLVSTLGKTYIKANDNDDNVDKFYEDFLETYPYDISMYNKKEPLVAIQVFFKEDKDFIFDTLKDKVKISRFFDTVSEFNAKQTFKCEATRAIMEAYNFSKDECMAIGDDLNDIDMFDEVKYAVCMGNGNEEAKKHAYFITDRIEKDGVYKALKHFNVIK